MLGFVSKLIYPQYERAHSHIHRYVRQVLKIDNCLANEESFQSLIIENIRTQHSERSTIQSIME